MPTQIAVQIHANVISKKRKAGTRRRTTPRDELHKEVRGQKKALKIFFPNEMIRERI
jgi:hypothetical protein